MTPQPLDPAKRARAEDAEADEQQVGLGAFTLEARIAEVQERGREAVDEQGVDLDA